MRHAPGAASKPELDRHELVEDRAHITDSVQLAWDRDMSSCPQLYL